MKKRPESLSAEKTQNESGEVKAQEKEKIHEPKQTRRWAGVFWTITGILTIIVSFLVFGIQYEILFPALVLTAYGLFVLWNPPIAESDGPWTGVVWIAIGIGILFVVQLFTLHWTIEINGIVIALFLILIGILVVLDL